ncbi:hypothetical protein V6N13_080732 [Hibiscus sabdariffa]|uniref:Uncharacterized protein n=1 Tax=Hibiscus sabdariffa TaxID=183260 RepID=A0ABR2CB33_9ROSI
MSNAKEQQSHTNQLLKVLSTDSSPYVNYHQVVEDYKQQDYETGGQMQLQLKKPETGSTNAPMFSGPRVCDTDKHVLLNATSH